MTAQPAILEEVVYEPVYNSDGKRIGWKPADHERERFEHGSGLATESYNPAADPTGAPKPRALDVIVAELDAYAIGEPRLYDQLAALYAREPLIADRIAARAVSGAQTESLHDPTAFLASRLRPNR